MAYNVHAPPRSTNDVDLWVRPTPRNLERLRAALAEFGLNVADLNARGDEHHAWLARDVGEDVGAARQRGVTVTAA